jgi:hypothetical protein
MTEAEIIEYQPLTPGRGQGLGAMTADIARATDDQDACHGGRLPLELRRDRHIVVLPTAYPPTPNYTDPMWLDLADAPAFSRTTPEFRTPATVRPI